MKREREAEDVALNRALIRLGEALANVMHVSEFDVPSARRIEKELRDAMTWTIRRVLQLRDEQKR